MTLQIFSLSADVDKLLILLSFYIISLFLSVLLKHHDLGHVALNLIDHVNEDSCAKIVLPRAMVELVKIVGQARWSLIKVIDFFFPFIYLHSELLVFSNLLT